MGVQASADGESESIVRRDSEVLWRDSMQAKESLAERRDVLHPRLDARSEHKCADTQLQAAKVIVCLVMAAEIGGEAEVPGEHEAGRCAPAGRHVVQRDRLGSATR